MRGVNNLTGGSCWQANYIILAVDFMLSYTLYRKARALRLRTYVLCVAAFAAQRRYRLHACESCQIVKLWQLRRRWGERQLKPRCIESTNGNCMRLVVFGREHFVLAIECALEMLGLLSDRSIGWPHYSRWSVECFKVETFFGTLRRPW